MRLLTFTLAATLTAFPLLSIGCAGGGSSSTPTESAAPTKVLAEPIEILVKVSGDQLPIETHGLGLIDQNALEGLGLDAAFAAAGVNVDLNVHSVVLFSLGQQATGGFSADINALQRKGNQVYIQGTAVAPGPDSVTTQAITYPYCAVATPKLPAGATILSDITSLP